jgi:hypothetical protein
MERNIGDGQMTLTGRANAYVDATVCTVDINKCSAGSHARAIKPGGIQAIVTSIKDDGYKRVN